MNPGKLRHKISIMKSTVAPSTSYGEVINTWVTFMKVWASIEPIIGSLSGRENFIGGQSLSMVDTKIILRHCPLTITPAMKVVWNGNNYNIETVLNINERNNEIVLMCEKQDLRTAT